MKDNTMFNPTSSAYSEIQPSTTVSYIKDDKISTDKAKKNLYQNRHMVLSTLSCGMGMGLFFASGQQISSAGAYGTIISYLIVGIMIVFMYLSCCELIVNFPGLNILDYSRVFICDSIGYAVSILYCLNQLIVFPLEIISAVLLTESYVSLNNYKGLVVTFYIALIFVFSFLNKKLYVEAEFVLNFAKVLMMIVFIFVAVMQIFGLVGINSPISNKSNNNLVIPGGFNTNPNGLLIKKIISVFITSIFSCSGVEYSAISLSTQEKSKVKKQIKNSSYQIIGRMLVFYVLPFFLIGMLVPYTNQNLMGAVDKDGLPINTYPKSPFALTFELHGIKLLPVIVDVVVILSLLSVSISSVNASAVLLKTMSKNGYLAAFLTKLLQDENKNKNLWANAIAFGFGSMAYLIYLPNYSIIFMYMVSIGGLSTIILWTVICISHIVFRSYLKKNKQNLSQLSYVSPSGIFGSYVAISINVVILCLTFWTSLWPVGSDGISISSFLQVYVGIPFFWFLVLIYKLTQNLYFGLAAENIQPRQANYIEQYFILDD